MYWLTVYLSWGRKRKYEGATMNKGPCLWASLLPAAWYSSPFLKKETGRERRGHISHIWAFCAFLLDFLKPCSFWSVWHIRLKSKLVNPTEKVRSPNLHAEVCSLHLLKQGNCLNTHIPPNISILTPLSSFVVQWVWKPVVSCNPITHFQCTLPTHSMIVFLTRKLRGERTIKHLCKGHNNNLQIFSQLHLSYSRNQFPVPTFSYTFVWVFFLTCVYCFGDRGEPKQF